MFFEVPTAMAFPTFSGAVNGVLRFIFEEHRLIYALLDLVSLTSSLYLRASEGKLAQ